MNTALWICQALLMIVFFYSGIYKSTKTEKQLVSMGQTGVEGLSPSLIRFIGVTELLGVVGIILPWLLQIVPVLTPVTAICFCIIMIPASIIHLRRREYKPAWGNWLVFFLALFVAVYRFKMLV